MATITDAQLGIAMFRLAVQYSTVGHATASFA
jgi:hypothetical protein